MSYRLPAKILRLSPYFDSQNKQFETTVKRDCSCGFSCPKTNRLQRVANSQGRQRIEDVIEQVRATDFMAAGTRGRAFSHVPILCGPL
jgi:hypothetical protein